MTKEKQILCQTNFISKRVTKIQGYENDKTELLRISQTVTLLSGVEDMTRNPKPINDQRKTDLVSNEFHLEKGYENILSGVEDMTRNPMSIDDQRNTDLVSNEFH
eukprot:654586_1